MPDNSQKLNLIRQIRQSGYPGSVTEVFEAHDQGIDLIGQWVSEQERIQQQNAMIEEAQQRGLGPDGRPIHPADGTAVTPPIQPMASRDGRVSSPPINNPIPEGKIDQGHLVQSQNSPNVGIQDLPTGSPTGQLIQAREGGLRLTDGGFSGITVKSGKREYVTDTPTPGGKEIKGLDAYNILKPGQSKNVYDVSRSRGPLKKFDYDDQGNIVGHSTHVMAHDPDSLEAWPTLFLNTDGSWLDLSDFSGKGGKAYQEAKKRGELYSGFGTTEEVEDFAKGVGWKDDITAPGYTGGSFRFGGAKPDYTKLFRTGGLQKFEHGGTTHGTSYDELSDEEKAALINEPFVEEDEYTNMAYDLYTSGFGVEGKYPEGATFVSQDEYDRLVEKYGPEIADHWFENQQGKSAIRSSVVQQYPTLGHDPGTGEVNLIENLLKKYTPGISVPEDHDFKSYGQDFNVLPDIEISDIGPKHTYPKSLTDWAQKVGYNLDENPLNLDLSGYLDPTHYLRQDESEGFYSGSLFDTDRTRLDNLMKWYSRPETEGVAIMGNLSQEYLDKNMGWFGDYANIPAFRGGMGNFGGTGRFETWEDYMRATKLFEQQQMGDVVRHGQQKFAGYLNEGVQKGLWEVAPSVLDLAATGLLYFPEPITSGIGAAWLTGRGAYGLGKQATLAGTPGYEHIDPIGFNLQTAGNLLYMAPGAGAAGGAMKTSGAFSAANRFGMKYAPGATSIGRDYIVKPTLNYISGAKEAITKPFTNIPFRLNSGVTSKNLSTIENIGQRFSNTALGRTFNYNIKGIGEGLQGLKYGNQPFTNPLSRRLFTNRQQLRVPSAGGGGGIVYAPGQKINLAGNIANRFRGAAGASYYTTKAIGQPLAGYGTIDYLSQGLQDPGTFTDREKTLQFGTDLANTYFGGLTTATDLFKSGVYYAQGDKDKAAAEFAGVFNPFKTVARTYKTIKKIKGLSDEDSPTSSLFESTALNPQLSYTSQSFNPNIASGSPIIRGQSNPGNIQLSPYLTKMFEARD
tara:strand:+ start:892 stop:3942 length:3051 start_codon:yes stop_codon:yes gene_type:complete